MKNHNIYLSLVLFFLYSFTAPSTPTPPKQPNIIILFCDDLGYGDLGIYGHPTIHTPHLDRMAADGMKFTQFYSGSPACTASRYALLTGKYPVRSGFGWVLYPKSKRGIHKKEITLAEGLKKAGYRTAIFGKWHLGSIKKDFLPLQNGFDEYLGLPYSNDMLPPKQPDIALLSGNDTIEMNPDQTTLTKRYTEKALAFIKKNPSEPFFLYLPYAMPHIPLMPGKEFAGRSTRGTYGDTVEEIDWSAGAILKQLEDLGISDNTLVFFTSDNGPWIIKNEKGGSSGLLRDGKGSTWEGGMRVPGIAYWEGNIAAGIVAQTPVSTLDLYETCLSLAGVKETEIPPNDGRDLTSILFGKEKSRSEAPFFYYGLNNELFAVRKGPWKLHQKTYSQTGQNYFGDKSPLLFNLGVDPSEQYELSDKYPEIVRELQQEIEKHQAEVEKEPGFYSESEP